MPKSLQIETPTSGYERLMPFNRVAVERLGGIVLMHFGLVHSSGLLDYYTCAILEVELEAQKESLMEYLGRSGSLGEAPETWTPPNDRRKIDLCNFIGVCGNPDVAEITLNNFVERAMPGASATPKDRTLAAQPVALLRSEMRLHKHWIRMLFPQ